MCGQALSSSISLKDLLRMNQFGIGVLMKEEEKEKEKKKDNQYKLNKAMAIAIGLITSATLSTYKFFNFFHLPMNEGSV